MKTCHFYEKTYRARILIESARFPPFGFATPEISSNSIENVENASTPDSDRERLISPLRVRHTRDKLLACLWDLVGPHGLFVGPQGLFVSRPCLLMEPRGTSWPLCGTSRVVCWLWDIGRCLVGRASLRQVLHGLTV